MTEKREKYDAGNEIPEQQNTIASEPTFTEAPASVNFRFDWKGWNVQLTIRDEKVNSALKKMEAAIGHLEGMGARPLSQRGNDGGGGNGGNSQASTNQGEAPLCPTHNKPMLASKHRPGEWYCPVKIADDDGTGKPFYCKQKVR